MLYRSLMTIRFKTLFVDTYRSFVETPIKVMPGSSLRLTLRLPSRQSNTSEVIFMPVNQLFIKVMEQEQKFNGLDRRHVAQIVRRMMIQKVKPSKKVYDRKKFLKGLPSQD